MNILQSSLKIKNKPLKNRLIYPPMGTGMANADGTVNNALVQYYEERANGGYLSMIIVEHSFVSQQGKASERQLSVADDDKIAGLKRIAETIQKHDVKAVLQLNHAGMATSSMITGVETVSASALASGGGREISHPLSKAEIRNIVSDFANAALRAKKAGFDGVEIHSAHSYLLNQFYSPYFNRRQDEYGGDVLGRIRIHMEIINAVRSKVGEDYPLFLRLGACDYTEGGTTIEDSIIAAREFEKAGIDVLDVSGGIYGFNVPGCEKEEGWFADITKSLKQHISLPVILTGGIRNLHTAETFLEEDVADLIGIGRPIYKNPAWLKESLEKL